MKDFRSLFVTPGTSIRGAVEVIDRTGRQIALVVDDDEKLLGLVSDGDIRRAILDDVPFDSPVSRIMNTSPVTASSHSGSNRLLTLMKERNLRSVPLVDESGLVTGLVNLQELLSPRHRGNAVVIMAGGMGVRLQPLTLSRPKPLVEVGGRPVLEIILQRFIEQGFNRFYLSVNYKGHMIEDYFGDGSLWGADIRYLREDRRLGTAGALGLIEEKPAEPLVVMNGDLLTKVDFGHLLDFHREYEAWGTMCVRRYDFQLPYGVCQIDRHHLREIEEKPVQRFFVNAGIYVIDPRVLDMVPKGEEYDMPRLFQGLMDQGRTVTAFPVREYWLDIGRMEDFQRANADYLEHFADIS